MSTNGYIALAWVATFLSVGLYAASVIRKGRQLSREVAPEDRRWM